MHDPLIPRDLDLELLLIAVLHDEAESLLREHEEAPPTPRRG